VKILRGFVFIWGKILVLTSFLKPVSSTSFQDCMWQQVYFLIFHIQKSYTKLRDFKDKDIGGGTILGWILER
jgi:hypothetical protein